jgi:hypothetical protein
MGKSISSASLVGLLLPVSAIAAMEFKSVTLKENDEATKSIGAAHGTWVYVDGEARITWDDGWHDAIRKVGSKHEKFAYAPGKSFSDNPTNVTEARNTSPQPA